ncbi:DNA mismatch repair protein [Treponema primitia ZAS-2]|uniref:DNA mismatch repair protein MutL n=1 Tax=Treponema primitia (strain ATCC BAA-887 / DSM 12427 / ZAS-2) TaxID=545694 RepID=F5YH36_TREPZ|nr:DNA mismatch repair endonuclease MutL [Treponema primitia]AEF84371.1 DNA mismatch repair protein [Treponema primitia ZAS-2]
MAENADAQGTFRLKPALQAAVPEDRRILVLPPEEARKIAAGEVVDRPAALVRELLDNAIDAGGATIDLIIEGGGIGRTEVLDDGAGMSREDLAICWQTHATSKIRSMEDLKTAETLGFRGEALAAVATVSRLEILTSIDGREAWQLTVGPGGGDCHIEQFHRTKGTSVRALGLFDTIPARKRFLKREGSEAALCRQIFLEKALAFPALNFHFTQDGKLKLFLPAVSSRKERFAYALLDNREGAFLQEIAAQGEGFRVTIVVGGPELHRSDRRQQYIFANGRRIQDFSLLQALEYGVQGWFPNGTHPVGAVYIDIDPELADFNIHPAKREARFKDPGEIHHCISSALRNFMHHLNPGISAPYLPDANAVANQPTLPYQGGPGSRAPQNWADRGDPASFLGQAPFATQFPAHASSALALEALLERPPAFAPLPGRNRGEKADMAVEPEPIYGEADTSGMVAESGTVYDESKASELRVRLAGRAFGLFLLVEKGARLFVIDQHAAHERILYDRFLSKPILAQELLVPIPFSTESEDDDTFLSARREELEKLGISIGNEGEGRWIIEALPAGWQLGDGETVEEILKLRTAGENIAERWAATLSCHAAVKDGDYLDDTSARELAEAALALPIHRCPHGRPIWVEISREELFRGVQRT